jgi:hypothetical protein
MVVGSTRPWAGCAVERRSSTKKKVKVAGHFTKIRINISSSFESTYIKNVEGSEDSLEGLARIIACWITV